MIFEPTIMLDILLLKTTTMNGQATNPLTRSHIMRKATAFCLCFVTLLFSCKGGADKGNFPKAEIAGWIEKDQKLSDLLKSIKTKYPSQREQALAIFHQVPALLKLPKVDGDITEEIYDQYAELDIEPHTVFQELAVVNYLSPKLEITDRVLLACFLVNSKKSADIYAAAQMHFGYRKVPTPLAVWFFGKDIDAIISFALPPGTKDWTKTGAVQMWRL